MTKGKRALVSAQPLGRIIRRSELAELGGHSTDWVDRAARQKNSPLVAIRSPKGYIMGFTEASVRKFLKCPIKGGEVMTAADVRAILSPAATANGGEK